MPFVPEATRLHGCRQFKCINCEAVEFDANWYEPNIKSQFCIKCNADVSSKFISHPFVQFYDGTLNINWCPHGGLINAEMKIKKNGVQLFFKLWCDCSEGREMSFLYTDQDDERFTLQYYGMTFHTIQDVVKAFNKKHAYICSYDFECQYKDSFNSEEDINDGA